MPAALRATPVETQGHLHVILWFWATIMFWSPPYAALYYLLGCTRAAAAICLWSVFGCAVPLIIRRTGSVRLAGNFYVLVLTSLLVVLISLTGGGSSPVRVWLVLIPPLAVTLSGLRSTIMLTAIVVGFLVSLAVLERLGYRAISELRGADTRFLGIVSLTTLIVVVAVFALTYEHFQRRTVARIHERADALRVALDENVAIQRELQSTNASLARQIQERLQAEQALRTSEGLLSNVLAHIPFYVFWKDRELRYLGCNQHFAAIAACAAPENIRGKTDYDLVWTLEEADWFRECDRRVMESGEPLIDLEESMHRSDGTTATLLTSKVPLRDEGGRVFGVLGIFADITARKQLEMRLHLQSSALAAAANAVVITDTSGRMIWVNPAFSELTGYSYEEAVGQFPSMLKSGEHPPAFYSRLWKIISGGQVWRGQMRNRRKDGRIYDEEMTITPVRGADGAVTHYVAIKQDITERKRGERLIRERDQLHASVKAHEQFLGVVGHELRTPLAGLMIIAEFLLREDARNTAEFDGFIRSIHDEVERMSGVVNDLIEVARLNSGIAKFHWGNVNLIRAATEAMATIRPLVDPQNVRLAVHVDPPDMTMCGDECAIRRLIINLLSNAQKHTRSGAIGVSITAVTVDDTPHVELAVSDTGAGMSPETAARLGEAFALNAGVVGEKNVSGSGLGLAICRGIVSAHGGTIAIQSKLNEGTICRVRLRADLLAALASDQLAEITTEAQT